jgi:hypothetical protein
VLHDTTYDNPRNISCPACHFVVCARCAALEDRMSPDGLCGCEECQRFLKRTQRAYRAHRVKDHGEEPRL